MNIITILVLAIFTYAIVTIVANIRLGILGSKIMRKPNNQLVDNYTEILKFVPIDNKPKEWQKLRSVFFVVYNSENVSKDRKKKLYDRLVRKGCNLGNIKFDYMTNEERIRKSGEDGEKKVAYFLKWLPNEYRVLSNVFLNSSIERQEFDNIIIGPNGIFHIETKNYGGENGCKIKISSNGDWIREYNGNESGMDNPAFQLSRHQRVLEENIEKHYGKGSYDVKGIIVLSNSKTILEGAENSDEVVLKADSLVKYISNYKGSKSISEEEINDIYLKLK